MALRSYAPPMRALALLLAILIAPFAAHAVESDAVESPRARVTLVADRLAVAPGQPFRLALRQVLAPGWHTYWTNPGDAGEPPSLELTMPDGGQAGAMAFPAPLPIPYGPLVNFGYLGEATFPLILTPPATLEPGRLYTIEGTARWLVCADICIPEEGAFRLDLPVEAAPRPDPATAGLFRQAEAALPRPSPFAVRLGFEGQRGAIELAGPDLKPGTVKDAFFFPEAPGVLDNTAPQALSVRDGALVLSLTRGAPPVPPSLSGVVAITDAAGVRSAYAISAEPGAMPAAASGLPLWQVAVLAVLGGLILNLMPCVFPVLAMKAMGLARLSGASRDAVRGEALAYVAGVVLAFLAIGGALVALRAVGMAAGWGFQFTSPVFVAAMAWLMLAVGLNLSGVYAVGGPVLGAGRWGSLGTGVLAVAVATPCTAPFMAAALGAAMVMPPLAALAVFGAMGLGMALPHGALAAFPALARLLPRPGAWMERMRQALAFPMYGAAAWLAWVVSVQSGPDGLVWLLAGALLLGFAAWALGVAQAAGRRLWIGRGTALLALLAALALLPRVDAAAPSTTRVEAAGEAWSEARLAALRAEGRPVFVNLTAAWCITCRVNEHVALETEATRAAFAREGVTLLTGDWTRGDPAVTALLRAQGREGVPLYLFYPARGGEPVVLPQILTEAMVIEAISSGREAAKPAA
ncbi:protein-disulfide reductase DsbD family protein [Roseomonas xinghualingensis]|uniref:protein-disulfide reductase DsbD family protein n=1 Tax=Roseomonas xinghualingensis TaxID=2986475 RepID=UPI0021F1E1F2|nr:thioredoxin family protein [Roseomonas sp. SXEYE001]MCV4206425.1 protein-disulfide reductase DsbD family protein [Roseomonas sp. SXEYE001]